MVTWFVRGKDGDNLNSGGTNSPAPELAISDLHVDGNRATSPTGGFRGTGSTSINIQNSGDNIRLFEALDDKTVLLSTPLATEAGVFPARVGGARASVNRVSNSGVHNNPCLKESDIVFVHGGFYYETVDLDLPCVLRAFNGQVTLDGSGQGAGTSPLTMVAGASVNGVTVINSVDHGITWRPYRSRPPNGPISVEQAHGQPRDSAHHSGRHRKGGKMLEFLGKLLEALRGAESSSPPISSVSQSQQSQVGHSLHNVVVNASGGDGISLPQVQRVTQGYPASFVRAAFISGAIFGVSLCSLVWFFLPA